MAPTAPVSGTGTQQGQTYSNSGIPASALRIQNPDPNMAPTSPVSGTGTQQGQDSQQTYSNSGIPASALRIINPDPSMAPPPSHPSTGDIEPPPPQEEPEIQEPVRMAPNVPRSLESPYKGKTELDPEPAGGRPPPSENNANSGSED